ncbi:tetratricopeptide repeat protein [Nitrospira sp. KM1]|uniref:tetratricopeptide repeat protein n=1 Tax=Nitrospira sp. KM1 TaxID=1936990 RepID=UPI00156647A5|nr:tetratricopeptide repeat protein [Nitrospira sp. KM1]
MYVMRTDTWASSLYDEHIYIDDHEVARLSPGGYYVLPLRPGVHHLTTKMFLRPELHGLLVTETGRTYYIRIGVETPRTTIVDGTDSRRIEYLKPESGGPLLESMKLQKQSISHPLPLSPKSEEEYLAAIAAAESAGQHATLAAALNEMGQFYLDQSRLREAERLYLRARAWAERAGLPGELSRSLNGLGMVCEGTSRLVEAEAYYRHAIQVDESLNQELQASSTQLAAHLSNLANLYRHQQRYDEAEPLYQRSQNLYINLGDTESLAVNLSNQAYVFASQHRDEDAELLFRTALAQFQLSPYARPTYVASNLRGLASLYVRQHRYGEAEPLLEQAIVALGGAATGPAKDNIRLFLLTCLINVAEVQLAQGHTADARISYQRAALSAEITLGSQHPEVLSLKKTLDHIL